MNEPVNIPVNPQLQKQIDGINFLLQCCDLAPIPGPEQRKAIAIGQEIANVLLGFFNAANINIPAAEGKPEEAQPEKEKEPEKEDTDKTDDAPEEKVQSFTRRPGKAKRH